MRPQLGSRAGEGGLHQRRSGDRLRDASRGVVRFCATNFDFDDALRAFAVGNDLQGERTADIFESFDERRDARTYPHLMRGRPAAPLASTSKVSLVEVSPSMEMALKVRDVTSCRVFCSSAGAMAASVATKASMVAMLG